MGEPDSDVFVAFAEQALPAYLARAINEMGEAWGGSPLLVLATPEREDLEVYLLTGDSAADRMREMYEAVRGGEDMPTAGAYVVSAPMITPYSAPAPVSTEAMLVLACADFDGREAVTAKRLCFDAKGAAQVDDLPDDVRPSYVRSELASVLKAILELAGLERTGLLRLGEKNWTLLLAGSLERLNSKSG